MYDVYIPRFSLNKRIKRGNVFVVYVTTIGIIVLPGSSRNAPLYTFISTGISGGIAMINN